MAAMGAEDGAVRYLIMMQNDLALLSLCRSMLSSEYVWTGNHKVSSDPGSLGLLSD